LLADLRKEIIDNALVINKPGKEPASAVHVIDLAKIRDSCPSLVSAFQEVLRVRSNAAPTRVVYEDILLNEQYLLKAGNVLQMPAHTINRERSSWGEQADHFNPARFMGAEDATTKGPRRMTGFMSFGVSPNICPGRHFASGEVLALVAMVLLRYDITPDGGVWEEPKLNPRAVAAAITPPVDAFNVRVAGRAEYVDMTWAFSVTEGKGRFNLVTG
jgi:cytochrome P450